MPGQSEEVITNHLATGHLQHQLSQTDEGVDVFSSTEDDPVHIALREEQKENEQLRETNRRLASEQRVLINRLKNLQQPLSVEPESSELLLASVSEDLLDGLIRENFTRQQQTESKTMEIEKLQRERDGYVEQCNQQRMQLECKDSEIQQLKGQVQEQQSHLQELAAQCRQLVEEQDQAKTRVITKHLEKLAISSNENGLAQVLQENAQMQANYNKLQEQFKVVLANNKRWEEYDKQREKHIDELNREKQQLQEGENELRHLAAVARSQEINIQQLQTALQQANKEREEMHVLRSQLQVFSEDFRQERKDRENAQARVAKLQEENELIKQQLEQFQTAHMSFLAQRRANSMQAHRDEYYRQRALESNGPRSNLVSHNYVYGHVVADGSDDEDQDVIDEPVVPPRAPPTHTSGSSGSGSSTSGPITAPPAQQSMLTCPKCQRQFPVDDPMQFLDHNDQCDS